MPINLNLNLRRWPSLQHHRGTCAEGPLNKSTPRFVMLANQLSLHAFRPEIANSRIFSWAQTQKPCYKLASIGSKDAHAWAKAWPKISWRAGRYPQILHLFWTLQTTIALWGVSGPKRRCCSLWGQGLEWHLGAESDSGCQQKTDLQICLHGRPIRRSPCNQILAFNISVNNWKAEVYNHKSLADSQVVFK